MKKHTGKWVGLMLHHTATSSSKSVEDIRKIHANKGWSDVGYHYLLKLDGDKISIKNGRNYQYQGAHCDVGDYNNTYIGVALIGNFETTDSLNSAQFDALCYAIKHIMQKHALTQFKGHREAKATACPGKNINLNQIRKKLQEI